MPGNFRKYVSEDGSITYYNSEIDEHYHSTSGAESEAWQKHVNPADLQSYAARQSTLHILDFAFGLGYNSAAALSYIMSRQLPFTSVQITALENDPYIIREIKSLTTGFAEYPFFQRMATAANGYENRIQPFVYLENNIRFNLYLEDALAAVQRLKNNSIDVVFFDPFSSQKVPKFWTLDVFIQLYRKLRKGGCLTTYSCARHFRNKLDKAGFQWKNVQPGFERRGPSTIAYKT
jgi:tRNA U34 5-methylaminomethyl-2-thiouridine-forming methyltransferase MnmC